MITQLTFGLFSKHETFLDIISLSKLTSIQNIIDHYAVPEELHELFRMSLRVLIIENNEELNLSKEEYLSKFIKIFNRHSLPVGIYDIINNIVSKKYRFTTEDYEDLQFLYQKFIKAEKNDQRPNRLDYLRNLARSYIPFIRLSDLDLSSKYPKFLLLEDSSSEVFELVKIISESNFCDFISFLKRRELFNITVSVLVDLIWNTFIYSQFKNVSYSEKLEEILDLLVLTKLVQSKAKVTPNLLSFKLYLEQKVYDIDIRLICELYEKLKSQTTRLSFFQKNVFSNLHSVKFSENLIRLLDLELANSNNSNRALCFIEIKSLIMIIFYRHNIVNNILKTEIAKESLQSVLTQEKFLLSITSLVTNIERKKIEIKSIFSSMEKVKTFFENITQSQNQNANDSFEKSCLTIPITLLFLEVLPQTFFTLTLENSKNSKNSKSNFASIRVKLHEVYISILWKIFTEAENSELNPEIKKKITSIINNKDLVGIMGIFVQQIAEKKIHNFDDLFYLLERNLMKNLIKEKPIIYKIAKAYDRENLYSFYSAQFVQMLRKSDKVNTFFSALLTNQIFMKSLRVGFSGENQEKVRNVAEFLGLIQTSEGVNFNFGGVSEREKALLNSTHILLKKSEKFKEELKKLEMMNSKQNSTINNENQKNFSDLSTQPELTTVYEIFTSLVKLNIKIHPRDILYFIIQSNYYDNSKRDSSLNMSEVITILKSSIYYLLKQELRLFEMIPVTFGITNFLIMSFIQLIYSTQNEFFFNREATFITLMMIVSLMTFYALRKVIFKWTRFQYRDLIKQQIDNILIR